MDDLTLREHCEGGVSVLTVRGESDLWSGPQLDDCLIDLAALGRSRIVLDEAGSVWRARTGGSGVSWRSWG
jgi:hypothetical protein